MPKTIEPKLRKIGDYLHLEEDAIFSIPEYQRAYSRAKHTLDMVCDEAEDYEDCKISEYKAGLKAVSEPLEVL